MHPEGAFTPGCSANHLPPYIQKLDQLKSKGVDTVAVIASNDAWVMSAWGKVNGVKGDDIVRLLYPHLLVYVRSAVHNDGGLIEMKWIWGRMFD